MDYFLLTVAIILLVAARRVGMGADVDGPAGQLADRCCSCVVCMAGPNRRRRGNHLDNHYRDGCLGGAGRDCRNGGWRLGAPVAPEAVRRAAVFSLIGSIAGAILGATLGLPIPVMGPPLAALFGGALGALAGAALAERTRGETSSQSLRVGKAAFLGASVRHRRQNRRCHDSGRYRRRGLDSVN